MEDLINIVECDDHFGTATRRAFTQNFGCGPLAVSNEPASRNLGNLSSLKLLKHFGSVIKELKIYYSKEYHRFDYILENAIIEYCHEYVSKIEFNRADVWTMQEFTIFHPFKNVVEVKFFQCECMHLISGFNKWFPNAHTMIIKRQPELEYADRMMLENHFPALKHFKVESEPFIKEPIIVRRGYGNTNNYNIISFIKQNPQLESLSISFNSYDKNFGQMDNNQMRRLLYNFNGIKLDRDLLMTMELGLNNLTRLEFVFFGYHLQADYETFHFNQLKELSIHFDSSFNPQSCPLSIYAEKLELLELNGSDLAQFSHILLRNREVKMLKIDDFCQSTTKESVAGKLDLVSKLWNLSEMYIWSDRIIPSQIITLLTKCEHLMKLIVKSDKSLQLVEDFRTAMATIKPEWKAKIEDNILFITVTLKKSSPVV